MPHFMLSTALLGWQAGIVRFRWSDLQIFSSLCWALRWVPAAGSCFEYYGPCMPRNQGT